MTEAKRSLSDLKRKNIVVYDLEIKKPIGGDIGWGDYREMGISVGCAFDYRDMKYRVFLDDNIQELANRLSEPGTLVVAFNHIGFDNRLLKAHCADLKEGLKCYDLMLVSKKGAIGDQYKMVKGFKLDDHLKALKLPVKSGDGANAPIWWQEGKVGKVIDYCMNDVQVERVLFEYVWLTGKMASAYRSDPYAVDLPVIEG